MRPSPEWGEFRPAVPAIPGVSPDLARKIRVFREVGSNPRYAKILGRLQGLDRFTPEQLQQHYLGSADTFQWGWEQIAEMTSKKSCASFIRIS
ncbi:hypothetical protein HYT74_02690 [Candidatus Daviesbacteria bacterium]|nr:hypothetical protein [Candidatus Daviesbacteria bacterium]